jgi:hypothetical protein
MAWSSVGKTAAPGGDASALPPGGEAVYRRFTELLAARGDDTADVTMTPTPAGSAEPEDGTLPVPTYHPVAGTSLAILQGDGERALFLLYIDDRERIDSARERQIYIDFVRAAEDGLDEAAAAEVVDGMLANMESVFENVEACALRRAPWYYQHVRFIGEGDPPLFMAMPLSLRDVGAGSTGTLALDEAGREAVYQRFRALCAAAGETLAPDAPGEREDSGGALALTLRKPFPDFGWGEVYAPGLDGEVFQGFAAVISLDFAGNTGSATAAYTRSLDLCPLFLRAVYGEDAEAAAKRFADILSQAEEIEDAPDTRSCVVDAGDTRILYSQDAGHLLLLVMQK